MDLFLMAALFLAWLGQRHSPTPQNHVKTCAVLIACLIGFLLPLVFGFPLSRVLQPPSEAIDANLGQLEIKGLDNIDLNRGAYLIVIMQTDCAHCQDAVPELNELAEIEELPEVIALCTNEDYKIRRFEEEFQPSFPIGKIKEEDFWLLLGDGDIPRIILARDGRIRRVWDETIPDIDLIKLESVR